MPPVDSDLSKTATSETMTPAAADLKQFQATWHRISHELGQVMVDLDEIVEQLLIALFAGGHVLLEGVPGVGKTRLCRALGQVLDLGFRRIQFTPDLVPADVTGSTILVETDDGRKRFEFRPGPIFGNLVLADEINRATPKTQSALLEAMEEQSVSIGGETYSLPPPFMVVATQNPIELEGTFPLPEAQLDRFLFKLSVPAPSQQAMVEILKRTTGQSDPELKRVADAAQVCDMIALARQVPVAPHVLDYAAALVVATSVGDAAKAAGPGRWLRLGASPRAAQAMVRGAKVRALAQGRPCASVDDVRALVVASLRHRLLLSFEAEAEGRTADGLVADTLAAVPVPGRG